jgi:peroxiredoxin
MLMNKEAPALEIEEWLGDDLGQISDHRGKAVLLVFWATWCPHCRKEMPKLQELWQKHQDDDFMLIAVTRNSRGQTTEKVREYASENGLTMPIAIDPGGTSRAYGVSGIPAAAVVDKSGKVVWRNHPGQLTDSMLAEWL